MRSDYRKKSFRVGIYNFNPRSYMRSDYRKWCCRFGIQHFNPRSYMRSDQRRPHLVSYSKISIHAPTWEATEAVANKIKGDLFQSTLLHEKRQNHKMDICRLKRFQSTLLHEKRQKKKHCKIWVLTFQSTLLHEKRLSTTKTRHQKTDFNPRSYMRSDLCQFDRWLAFCNFNPRSYMRSDKCTLAGQGSRVYFNPRSYMRSDEHTARLTASY